ncbi:MAG: sigma-70 family RNA polymerase sigma factor [Candidatus Woesearchaeota archaeon]
MVSVRELADDGQAYQCRNLEQRAQVMDFKGNKDLVPKSRDAGSPCTSYDDCLSALMEHLKHYPPLSRERETELAKRIGQGDLQARNLMVISNMRFAVAMAHKYAKRNYDKDFLHDLVQEGAIGMVKAAEKFDHNKGYKFVTYAVWWLRSYMNNFIVRNVKSVKLGKTQSQRAIFSSMSEFKEAFEEFDADPKVLDELLAKHKMSFEDARDSMALFSSHTAYLDSPIDDVFGYTGKDLLKAQGRYDTPVFLEEEDTGRYINALVRGAVDHVVARARFESKGGRKFELYQTIARDRILSDEPVTLQDIGEQFKISRERVRQVEANLRKEIGSYVRGKMSPDEYDDFFRR